MEHQAHDDETYRCNSRSSRNAPHRNGTAVSQYTNLYVSTLSTDRKCLLASELVVDADLGLQMIAARFTKAVPCLRTPVPSRAVVGRAAAPGSSDQTPEAENVVDPSINPVTGNPQTGKLIDVYFEVGSFLVVVAVAFASMWNVKDVLNQTSSADSLRQPAPKAEWVAMDNQNVRHP